MMHTYQTPTPSYKRRKLLINHGTYPIGRISHKLSLCLQTYTLRLFATPFWILLSTNHTISGNHLSDQSEPESSFWITGQGKENLDKTKTNINYSFFHTSGSPLARTFLYTSHSDLLLKYLITSLHSCGILIYTIFLMLFLLQPGEIGNTYSDHHLLELTRLRLGGVAAFGLFTVARHCMEAWTAYEKKVRCWKNASIAINAYINWTNVWRFICSNYQVFCPVVIV